VILPQCAVSTVATGALALFPLVNLLLAACDIGLQPIGIRRGIKNDAREIGLWLSQGASISSADVLKCGDSPVGILKLKM
jgi:hypothetical protein